MSYILSMMILMSVVVTNQASAAKVQDKPNATISLDKKMKGVVDSSGPCYSAIQSETHIGDLTFLKFLPAFLYFTEQELRHEVSFMKNQAGDNCEQFKGAIDSFLAKIEDKTVAIEEGVKKCSISNIELEKEIKTVSERDFDPSLIFQGLRDVDFQSSSACDKTLLAFKKLKAQLQ